MKRVLLYDETTNKPIKLFSSWAQAMKYWRHNTLQPDSSMKEVSGFRMFVLLVLKHIKVY